MLKPCAAAREVADRMADAAQALLATLDANQRAQVGWAWSAESEVERRHWFYTPTDHGGLTVGEMTPTQYRRTMALVATGLSPAGFITVTTVMGLENALDYTEGFAGLDFGRERGRDPEMYYVRIFGTPGERMWGWRFGGHHVSLNNLVVDGSVVATTPCFLGADPASSPLLGSRLLRPLGGVEDLARELVRSLSHEHRARAVLTPRAPVDIIGGNRPRVIDNGGPDRLIPPPLLWRGCLGAGLDETLWTAHNNAERNYGITSADHDAVELIEAPKGLPARELDVSQRELLRAVLDCYTGRVPEELASAAADRYVGDQLDEVFFAWAGGTEPGQPHYYRLQGPRLLIEYDNTQRQVNHAHSVWRDPEGDFGLDVLAAHHVAHAH
ncbi:MAG: DUF3500 domain-containing protein [Pseudonocardia sp.]|nr:DUF3500 domain-containing protein [Pseudonocardia sp.]